MPELILHFFCDPGDDGLGYGNRLFIYVDPLAMN